MKTLLIASLALLSSNLMAATTLVCNDQNSRAVYKLVINDNNTKLSFLPILRDSSILSNSTAELRYNEGESNSFYSLFEGNNENNDTIIVEVKKADLSSRDTVAANIYFAASTSTILNQKTLFLCEVK